MVRKKIQIQRPDNNPAMKAVEFVNMADRFPCEVSLQANNSIYNGKSVISLIVGDFHYGMDVEVICNGEQEEEALLKISQWFLGEGVTDQ